MNRIAGIVSKSRSITAEVVESINQVQQLTKQGKRQSEESSKLFSSILLSVQSSADRMMSAEKEMKLLSMTIGSIREATSEAAVSAENFKESTERMKIHMKYELVLAMRLSFIYNSECCSATLR